MSKTGLKPQQGPTLCRSHRSSTLVATWKETKSGLEKEAGLPRHSNNVFETRHGFVVRTLSAVELTVSWEKNCHAANERKTLKYADVMEECREKGWRVSLFPVEIGCRGFLAQSVLKLMTALGMVSSARNTAARQLSEAEENGSCYIVGMTSTSRTGRLGASSGLATTTDPPIGGCHG